MNHISGDFKVYIYITICCHCSNKTVKHCKIVHQILGLTQFKYLIMKFIPGLQIRTRWITQILTVYVKKTEYKVIEWHSSNLKRYLCLSLLLVSFKSYLSSNSANSLSNITNASLIWNIHKIHVHNLFYHKAVKYS